MFKMNLRPKNSNREYFDYLMNILRATFVRQVPKLGIRELR